MNIILFAILMTLVSSLLIYSVYSDKWFTNDEKELLVVGSLGAPVVIPMLTVLLWVIILVHLFI